MHYEYVYIATKFYKKYIMHQHWSSWNARSLIHRPRRDDGQWLRLYFRLLTILVMACLMMVPAFSVSFFVRPLVTHTLSAGVGCQPASRGFSPRPRGKDLSRVMRTPFARHCNCQHIVQDQPYIHHQDTYLIDNFPKDLILVFDTQFLVFNDFVFQNK